ncbi:MAG: DUF2911 domain-containing protein [Holophagaceae bacterium]|nr:DUF2911 domain-containing protein [Holophagaceae bacterium]
MRLPITLLCASALLGAQGQAPVIKPAEPVRLTPFRTSPAATLTQDIGISSIKLTFNRPAVKGRAVWGDLVPFDKVWRTGANAATTLSFSDPCKVAGKSIPAGTYALFAIPGLGRWTLVLSRNAQQWGSYSYDAKEDVLRFEVSPESIPYEEWLDYRIRLTGEATARIELSWETLRVGFPVAFETKAIYWKHLESKIAVASDTDWVTWYQAADYCQKNEVHADLAGIWIDKSLRAGNSFWNQETKARILRWQGHVAESIIWMEKAIQTARALTADKQPPKEWFADKERELASWKSAVKGA